MLVNRTNVALTKINAFNKWTCCVTKHSRILANLDLWKRFQDLIKFSTCYKNLLNVLVASLKMWYFLAVYQGIHWYNLQFVFCLILCQTRYIKSVNSFFRLITCLIQQWNSILFIHTAHFISLLIWLIHVGPTLM